MSELSLYQVCLKAVVSYVKAGSWTSCSVNPFSSLPTEIVDDVMEAGKQDFKSISQILTILTSGSYTRLDLRPYSLEREWCAFQKVIERNGFRSLRYLTCSLGGRRGDPLLIAAIRSCSKLEELHASTIIDLEAFQNCKELKVLKFNVSLRHIRNVDVSVSSLSSVRSLKVFESNEGSGDVPVAVLKYCPRLISVGSTDSLNTLKKMRDCTDLRDHYKLKMCLWGKNEYALSGMKSKEYRYYKYSFREKVRNAVSLCPLVEKLIIYVCHINSLRCLEELKHLTYLKISFSECKDDYKVRLMSLLQVIGGKLKHLTFIDDLVQSLPVEMIFLFCPHLESLEIGRFVEFREPVKPVCNVELKRLHIIGANRHALLYLLSSCKAVEELTVEWAHCLEDTLLSEVLKLNPLERLKIIDIPIANLSEAALLSLYEVAVSLEEVIVPVNDPAFENYYPDLGRVMRRKNISYIKNKKRMNPSFTMFD